MKFTIPILSPIFQKDRSICILGNIRVLNILTFWDIIRTHNFKLLDRDYFDGKRYTPEQLSQLEDSWEKLCDEYFIAKKDDRSAIHLRKRNEQRILEHKIQAYNEGLELLNKVPMLVHLVDKLKLAEMLLNVCKLLVDVEPRSKIDPEKPLDVNIKAAQDILNALVNKYNNNYKEKNNNLNEEMFDGFELVASIEQVLNRALGDLSKIMVSQFIAYEKQVRNIVSKKNKVNGRK